MADRNGRHNSEQVRQLYRRFARDYDTFDAWWKLPTRKAYLALNRAFQAHLSPNGRILDLGCGTGLNVERLSALGLPFSSYFGVDFSEEMLARAKAKFGHLEKVDFKQMDLSKEPLPEGPFDLVISTWVLEHLPDPVSVVENAQQRLVPGGHLILLFMVKQGWVNLVAPLLKLLNAHTSYGVDENAYRRFPGMVSLGRFAGGTAALAILSKPEKSREMQHA